MTRAIPATRAKNNFGQLIREVYTSGEPVLIEKSGIPLVVLIPFAQFAAEPGAPTSRPAPRRGLGARHKRQGSATASESRRLPNERGTPSS